MSFALIASAFQAMQELRSQENQKKEELEQAFLELAVVQKRIASLQQDLSGLKSEFLRLDGEIRPKMAAYLKAGLPPQESEEFLF